MTNPSTGLPEELEKIVQHVLSQDLAEIESAVRNGFRDVLDWACKKACRSCAQGVEVSADGKWHLGHVSKVRLHACAASVLREGLSQK